VDVNQLLTDMAFADGNHDFAKKHAGPNKAVTVFNKSVLRAKIDNLSEEECLNTVANDPAFKDKVLGLGNNAMLDFTTKTGILFHVKAVDLTEADKGQDLVGRCGIDNAVLVVDTVSLRLFERLAGGAESQLRVAYVYTPESENDPASKVPPGDPMFRGLQTGVRLSSHTQTNGPVIYPGNIEYAAATPTNNFHSKYTFTLSKLRSYGFMNQIWKRKVHVTVKSGASVQESPDAKAGNSIASLLNSILLKAIKKLGKLTEGEIFSVNAAWARKRSGDWLQVLSCLSLHNQTFDPPLPPDMRPYFVTYDYIALAYAAAMGVDTIFFPAPTAAHPNPTRILVFSKTQFPGVDLAAIEARRAEAAAKAEAEKAAKEAACAAIVTQEKVKAILAFASALKKDVEDQKTAVLGNIQKRGFVGQPPQQFQYVLQQGLHYAHISFETEADELLAEFEPLRAWAEGGGPFPTPDICAKAFAVETADKIMFVHGNRPALPDKFIPNFSRKQEITNLNKWYETATRKPSFSKRLATLAGFDVRMVDKDVFSFLAYIARVDRASPLRQELLRWSQGDGSVAANAMPAGPTRDAVLALIRAMDQYIQIKDVPPVVTNAGGALESIAVVVQAIQENEAAEATDVIDPTDEDPPVKPGGGRARRRTVRKGGWKDMQFRQFAVLPNILALYPILAGHILLQRLDEVKATAPAGVPDAVMVDGPPPTRSEAEMIEQEAQAKDKHPDEHEKYPVSGGQRGGAINQRDLLPVYVMLEALCTQVGPDLQNSPDLYLFERLFAFLKLAADTPGIGYILREVLMTMVTTSTGRPIVEKALGSSLSFSLLCSALAQHVCGEFRGLDEAPGTALLSDPANMTMLQTMYSTAASQSAPMTLEDVRAFKADIAEKIVRSAPPPPPKREEGELGVYPAINVPAPPAEKDDLAGTVPSTPVGEVATPGGRRTRRRTQSFLPHRRHRTHHAMRMSSKRHSVSGTAASR